MDGLRRTRRRNEGRKEERKEDNRPVLVYGADLTSSPKQNETVFGIIKTIKTREKEREREREREERREGSGPHNKIFWVQGKYTDTKFQNYATRSTDKWAPLVLRVPTTDVNRELKNYNLSMNQFLCCLVTMIHSCISLNF